MGLHDKLKSLRYENDLTQEEFASGIGVSVQTINKWENEKALPDAVNLLRIASYYDVSLDSLMEHEASKMLEEKYRFKDIRKKVKKVIRNVGL